jgi:hypothetical protein
METPGAFLMIVQRRGDGAPVDDELFFDGVPLTFDGIALTFIPS